MQTIFQLRRQSDAGGLGTKRLDSDDEDFGAGYGTNKITWAGRQSSSYGFQMLSNTNLITFYRRKTNGVKRTGQRTLVVVCIVVVFPGWKSNKYQERVKESRNAPGSQGLGVRFKYTSVLLASQR